MSFIVIILALGFLALTVMGVKELHKNGVINPPTGSMLIILSTILCVWAVLALPI